MSSQPNPSAEDVRVVIMGADGHGIPFDVASSITGALGHLYPSAMMGPGDDMGVVGNRGFSIIINPEDRKRRSTSRLPRRAIAKSHEAADDSTGGVVGFDGDTVTVTPPHEAAEVLTHYGATLLEGLDAVNYVEQSARLPDGRGLTMTVQWQLGASPHEMRQRAEAERDTLRAHVEALTSGRAEEYMRVGRAALKMQAEGGTQALLADLIEEANK